MKIHFIYITLALIISSCSTNPYKKSEKEYDNKLKSFKEQLSNKETETLPSVSKITINIDSVYTKQLFTFKPVLFSFIAF